MIYYSVRNDEDKLVELVRVGLTKAIVVAGDSRGKQHTVSPYFDGTAPDTTQPVSFEIVTTSASAPILGELIETLNRVVADNDVVVKRQRSKAAQQSKPSIIQFVRGGATVREASELFDVPRSTVSRWTAEAA